MNTQKILLIGLLLAGTFLAFGCADSKRRKDVVAPAGCEPTVTLDPAVMSQLARAQASVALSQGGGAPDLLPFCS